MHNDVIFDFQFQRGQYAYFHGAETDVHVRVIGKIEGEDGSKYYKIIGPRDAMVAAGFDDDFPESSPEHWLINFADPDELSPAPPMRPFEMIEENFND